MAEVRVLLLGPEILIWRLRNPERCIPFDQ